MGNGFEIERKFLIYYPDANFLNGCGVSYDIEQVYLKDDDSGYSSRIRKRVCDGDAEYFLTRKKRISDLRRIELENMISEDEYAELKTKKDPDRNVIYKTRYCRESRGKVFEIDVFPFWNDRAIMEIELNDENDVFTVPQELTVIKEVTGDRRYTNSSISRYIPQDIIQE